MLPVACFEIGKLACPHVLILIVCQHQLWHKVPSDEEHACPVNSCPESACGSAGVSEARAEDGSVQQEIGGGISGSVGGRRVALGNWAWVAQHLRDPKSQPPDSGPSTLSAAGMSTSLQQKLQVGGTLALIMQHVHNTWRLRPCPC